MRQILPRGMKPCKLDNVRYALACRDATNNALVINRNPDYLGLGWLRHDKLKHIGHALVLYFWPLKPFAQFSGESSINEQ